MLKEQTSKRVAARDSAAHVERNPGGEQPKAGQRERTVKRSRRDQPRPGDCAPREGDDSG